MQPISNDTRAAIIEAKQRNEPVEQIKKWLNVSDSTISRIWNRFLKTGCYLPTPYTGRKSDITPEMDNKIKEKITETPDITLEELIGTLEINLTISGLSRRLAKMGLSYKKRRSTQTDKSAKMLSKSVQNGRNNKRN